MLAGRSRKFFGWLAFALLVATTAGPGGEWFAHASQQTLAPAGQTSDGQFILRASPETIDAVAARHGLTVLRYFGHNVYLVSAAYSLLMRSLHQSRPQEWARRMLTTIGEACRAVKGEQLGQLVDWIVDKLADDHWSVPQIKAVLAQT